MDDQDHIWIAYYSGALHYKNDGTSLGYVSTPGLVTGLSTDANGKVWAVGGNRYTRIDPNAGPLGLDGVTPEGAIDLIGPELPSGSDLYNYSDMTGSTLNGPAQQGTWSLVYDSGTANTVWGLVNWHAQVLGDGHIKVTVASSNDCQNFGPSVIASSGTALAHVAPGQCMRVNVHFKRATTGESPVLYDLSLYPAVPDLTVANITAIDNGAALAPSLQALIGNASLFDASAFDISFWHGDPANSAVPGTLLGVVAGTTLTADQAQLVTLPNVAHPIALGDAIYVQVDSGNAHAEYNEDNNWTHSALQVINQLGSIVVTSDQPSYPADQAISFTALSQNLGRFPAQFAMQLSVLDANQALVIEFAQTNLGSLASNAQHSHGQAWHSGNYLAGNYTLKGELFNAQGEVIASHSAAFSITAVSGNLAAALRISTDRPQYHRSDRVKLDALAQNLATNLHIEAAQVSISVRAPNSSVVFSQTLPLGQLSAQSVRVANAWQTLVQAELGTYQVQAELKNASNQVLATATTGFVVSELAPRVLPDLASDLTLGASHIQAGEAQHRSDQIHNTGATTINGLTVTLVLLRDADNLELSRSQHTIDLAPGQTQQWPQAPIATQHLETGAYTAILLAEKGGIYAPPAVQSFTVSRAANPITPKAIPFLGAVASLGLMLGLLLCAGWARRRRMG